jgi:ABC-type dipeptide/oligopeptide/nickel transport system permease component
MWAYIVRRLIFLPFLWLGVTLLIFALLQPLGPYQRLALYTQQNPESMSLRLRPEEMQRLINKYGLNDPFYVQYAKWLQQVLRGNLGWSKTAQAPVTVAIRQRLPTTLELTLLALGPMLLGAIFLGIYSAVHYRQPADHIIRGVTIAGYSLPTFVFAIFALLVFYGYLAWFPPGRLSLDLEQVAANPELFRRITGLMTIDGLLNARPDVSLDALRHMVLPVITLAYISWAGLTQVTRSAMLGAMGQEYVTTARAKGVPERQVIYKHARRNAMIPVTTISVSAAVGLLLGVFITETVFNIKGIGSLAVQAATTFDVPTVLGVALFSSSLIVLGNLVADILYTVVDPRIRYN